MSHADPQHIPAPTPRPSNDAKPDDGAMSDDDLEAVVGGGPPISTGTPRSTTDGDDTSAFPPSL